MMPHILSIFLILPLATFEFAIGKEARIQDSGENRRILHQSLFPDSSPPPPPPPLLPSVPATPDQDQPFYHETGPTPDQVQQSPPAPAYGTPVANPTVNQQQQQQQAATKPIKKVAIAISVGTVILGMLSALAFYLYKHRVRQTDESQKLVGSNSQRTNDPPSTFLNIGAVEPSTTGTVSTDTNSSPYRKLNSGKRSDRYRPSPDLQPLPPLTKPPLPPNINSPPPMSSSDDESHETNFYTPQELSMINESPRSRQFYSGNNTGQMNQARPDSSVSSPLPHSKRSSPKSRLSASSPDKKYPVIPPIKQSLPSPSPPTATSPLGPLQASRPAPPNIPNRAKIPAPPPPPPNMAHLQSTKEEEQQASKFPMRPPPPPPPPPPSFPIPRKLGAVGTNKPPVPKKSVRPQSKSPSPKSSPGAERRSPVKEVTKALSTPRKLDDDDDDEKDDSKPKLKPLHWDKVRATSDRATVWDSLKSSSFQLNEDAMESLFGCKSTNSATKESTRKSVLPPLEREIRVLDPKKSQNIAIMLRALNVTRDEVAEALLDGSSEGLGLELLETLVKMAPTKEEEIKLKDYSGDSSKLGTAERFLKAILDIPFAFRRVEAMLYRENFSTEVKYLRKSFQTLEEASEELKSSHLFIKLLEAVLRTGNRMNVGTNRGGARAFKLDTLLKLVDIKGTDGKTTLLHFVVQEIIRSEGAGSDPITDCHPHKTNFRSEDEDFKKQGLQVVAGLSKELGNVKKAAGMDSDVLSSYVSKLEMGLEKVRLILQHEKQSIQGKFFNSMKMFLKEAEDEIIRIKAEERKALSMVKEVTEYFHGDAAKVEAHPLRIFMIVRDFLSILDNVCKDVGRMQEKTTVGAGRSFRVPANASLPVLSRYNMWHDRSSDDDSM